MKCHILYELQAILVVVLLFTDMFTLILVSAAMALPFSSFPNVNSLLIVDDFQIQVITFILKAIMVYNTTSKYSRLDGVSEELLGVNGVSRRGEARGGKAVSAEEILASVINLTKLACPVQCFMSRSKGW